MSSSSFDGLWHHLCKYKCALLWDIYPALQIVWQRMRKGWCTRKGYKCKCFAHDHHRDVMSQRLWMSLVCVRIVRRCSDRCATCSPYSVALCAKSRPALRAGSSQLESRTGLFPHHHILASADDGLGAVHCKCASRMGFLQYNHCARRVRFGCTRHKSKVSLSLHIL